MDAEPLIKAALREAGYGPDAIGSALPRIMKLLQAEDVRIEVGRPLTRKEREYVRVQLEIGLDVPEIVDTMKARSSGTGISVHQAGSGDIAVVGGHARAPHFC